MESKWKPRLWDPGTQITLPISQQEQGATNKSSLRLGEVQKLEEISAIWWRCEGMSESCDGTKIPRKASGTLSPALKHEAMVAHL